MADITSILSGAQADQKAKADAWEVANSAKDEADFTGRLGGLAIPQETKAALWEFKFGGAAKVPGMEKIGGIAPSAPKPPVSEGLRGAPAPQQPPSEGYGEFWKEVKNGPANVLAMGNAINNAVMHPINTLEGMGAQISGTASKAKKSALEGDYIGAVRHAGNTALNVAMPGLGTSSDEAGDMLARGDYKGGLSKTAGIGVNTALGVKTPQIAKAATKIPAAVKSLTRVDPRVAINRSLRPTPSDPNFSQRIPQTVKAVKAANEGKTPGGITDGTLDLIPATKKAIEQHQAALDTWIDRAKGVMVNGDEIVDATRQAIPKIMWTRDAAGAQALIDDAQRAFGGRQFSVADFRDFLRSDNADLSPFYARAPGVQQNAVAAGTPPGIQSAQTGRIREVLYKALDPEGEGSGPRTIQAKTGDLIDIRDAAMRRQNAIIAEQPLTPLGKVLDPLKAGIRAVLPGKATGAGIAFAEGSEGRSLPLIRRAFKSVGDEPANALPLPGSELYPTGDLRRQIAGPRPALPPAPDPSGVRSVPGVGSLTPNRKLLPQGPDLIPPAPVDPSNVRGAPAMYPTGPNPARALSPASTIEVPPSPISRGGTMVPERTGVPGDDASMVRSVSGEFPPNVFDKAAIEKFGKPFAALTPEQKRFIQERPPALGAPPESRRPPALGAPGQR